MKYLLTNQETEHLYFREVMPTDVDEWMPFFTDPRTHLYWPEERGQPDEECKKWYEKQYYRYENDLGGMNALIEKSSGALVGHAGLLVQEVDGRAELEVAYSLLPDYWHRGFAIEAAIKCKTFAFAMDYAPSLISIISITNIPSQKVAMKNGMQIEKQTLYKKIPVYIFRVVNSHEKKSSNFKAGNI